MAEQNLLKREITDEDISTFLNGHDPEERIVNIEYNGRDDKITVYYRNENDQRCVSNRPFYPFLWAKFSVGMKMKENAAKMAAKGELQAKQRINWEGADFLLKYKNVPCKTLNEYMKASGIWVKMLEIHDKDGNAVPDMENGYCLQFYATKPMAYYDFLDFFKTLGLPVYGKGDDDGQTRNSSKDYLTITPVEQYLISTGKRFFKGYDDYNDLLRMIFDLETTGLDTTKDRIEQFGIRFNRPFKYNGKDMTFERILTVGGDSEEEKDKNELECINIAMQIIQIFKPDVITAHNGENFDWNMIAGACKRLGTSLEEVSKKYFNGQPIYKSERESILKLGGEIEKFNPTIVPGITVTDSMHAVRRAQATDSNFAKASLKYSIKYLNLQKSNRVYVPGSKITDVWNDMEEHYAFNDSNGDWYLYDPKSDNSYKFDGETERKFIPVYNTIADGYVLKSGRYIVQRYLLDDLWECDKIELSLNQSAFNICKNLPLPFKKCCTMGTAGQWKSLMLAWSYENGLAIPKAEDTGSFVGGLSRLLCVGASGPGLVKFDYNSLYPSIVMTWGIEDEKDISGVTLKFLNYFLTTRETYKAKKKAADKIIGKYEEKINNKETLTPDELAEYNKALKDFSIADNLQLVRKVFCNSFFGSYGSNRGAVYPWKSVKCAERTTCTGRQSLRLMISHFKNLDYQPIVGDTDGFNFKTPDESKYRYTKEHPYISPGLSRETKEGKVYTGFEADLAEFNDLFMKDFHYSPNGINKMGCGLDECINFSVNISRKNYLDYFPEKPFPKDVKIVGNTLKSKKMPTYIAKFLEKAVRLLLQSKGQEFLNEYYDEIEKIYNYQIPLKDIASKGKVKNSIAEYKEECKEITKAGRPKSRQAWMELAISEGLDVKVGDTIYYVNTGKAKSHADCKKTKVFYRINPDTGEKIICTGEMDKNFKAYKKKLKEEGDTVGYNIANIDDFVKTFHSDVRGEDKITLNCKLLPLSVAESDVDTFCDETIEYNVDKYIAQFNNRITPLLVCFSPKIRNKIIVTKPSERNFFTEEESQLVSGCPNKPEDQDTYEQLMTMDDREIRFWMSHPEWEIPFLKECGMDWDKIVEDYEIRKEREKQLGVDKTREAYEAALSELTEKDVDKLTEDGTLPASISKLVDIDPVTGNFVDKTYKDIVIGTISDLLVENFETSDD